jgi:hypothetical protein
MSRLFEETIGIASPLAHAMHRLSSSAAVYGADIIAESARLSVYVGKPYMRGPAMHALEEVRVAIKAVSDALSDVDAAIAAEIAADEPVELEQAAE